jgi:predicted nucleic acid-binding Zn ribbon protein
MSTPLNQAIKQFLQKSKLQTGIRALQIEDVWEELMGKTIAKYTQKIEIHGQKLFIQTDVAALKQEIVFQKKQIIERVNEMFGEKVIEEVVVK